MIYILNQTGSALYKLGKSKNVEVRLKQLQTGTPFPLQIVKTFKVDSFIESLLERTIHRSFASYKTQGEWFDFDNLSIDSVIQTIEQLSNAVTLIQTPKKDEVVRLTNRNF